MKEKLVKIFSITGILPAIHITKLIAGEDKKESWKGLMRTLLLPFIAFIAFLFIWEQVAQGVDTSLGRLPGPTMVYEQSIALKKEHIDERKKAEVFYARQEARNEKIKANNPNVETKIRDYTGKPTYLDQIITSLYTVFTGFLIAMLFAIPLGVLCGVSKNVMAALSPLIQVFKPVSPLAWLPIVTMVVSAVYVTNDGWFEKSFLTSAITVSLCTVWPGLINTAAGVASIDKDYINVGRVLKLNFFTRIFKIVLPASLPQIFTGLRISLGVGWMVLIAAEMLAQNPGLGKFVWDEFQNGSSNSLARIMVAVFTIGVIGFVLDKIMTSFQKMVSFSDAETTI